VELIKPSGQFPFDKEEFLLLLKQGYVQGQPVSGRFGILTRSNAMARKLASVCMEDSQLRPKVKLVQSPEGMGFPGWLGILCDQASGRNLADEKVLNQAYANVPGDRKPDLIDVRNYIEDVARALGLKKQSKIDANSLLDALVGGDEPPELRLASDPQGIWISTVHQSKGRQFSEVFLDESGLLGDHLAGRDRNEQLESVRITYVAATRATGKINSISGQVVSGLVDWESDQDQLPNGGGIDDIKHWEKWYHLLGDSWETARNFLWDVYQRDGFLKIWNDDGKWSLAIGPNSIGLDPYYNQILSVKTGNLGARAEFVCRILDLRSRVSGGRVFLMPVLSGRLEKRPGLAI
jgi:hypothetical protein